MDTSKCGACGVENPKGRVTCQVCHEPLRREGKEKPEIKKDKTELAPEKMDNKQSKPEPPNPFDDGGKDIPTPTKKTRKKVPAKKTLKEVPAEMTPDAAQPKPKIKRRRRTKSTVEAQYFKLEGDALVPVEIQIRIHSLKKKGIGSAAASLIDLWNRNKSLLKN